MNHDRELDVYLTVRHVQSARPQTVTSKVTLATALSFKTIMFLNFLPYHDQLAVTTVHHLVTLNIGQCQLVSGKISKISLSIAIHVSD